jgi:hypothetical protein
MITLTRCAKLVKLDLDALVVDRAPSARHHALLKSYLFGEHRGHAEVLRRCRKIIESIWRGDSLRLRSDLSRRHD